MNLLNKKALNLFKSFLYVPQRSFVGLEPGIVKKLINIESPRKYYEELLDEAPINEKGLLKIEPVHLARLIEKSKEADDINLLVEAYYNFLGHRTFFTHTTIDSLIIKAIECQNPQATLDILKYHNNLMYYPNPEVLDRLMAYYKDTKNIEEATKLIDTVSRNKLMKFNAPFIESAIYLSNDANEHNLAFKAYQFAKNHNIKISDDAAKALIDSLYKFQTAAAEKKAIGVENDLLAELKDLKLDRSDYLKLSLGQSVYLENAIKTFEIMAETHEPTLAADELFFDNSELNQQYFNTIYPLIEEHLAFYTRLTNAIKLIKKRYGKNAVAPEVLNIIYQANVKTGEKTKQKSEERESRRGTREAPANAEAQPAEEQAKQ